MKATRIGEQKTNAILEEIGVDRERNVERAVRHWRNAALLGDEWALIRLKELASRSETASYLTAEDMDLVNGVRRRAVLIADDDSTIRQEIAHALGDDDFRVKFAADGQEAIDMLREHVVDLIFLDIKMPKVSGFEVLSYLAEHELDLQIVICTGYATPDHLKKLREQGLDRILQKPLQREMILSTIEELTS